MKNWFMLILFFITLEEVKAQKQFLYSRDMHLRDGGKQEWSSFPVHAKDSQMVIRFNADDISVESCLSITQYDVNHIWKVILNEKPLGNLVIDEKPSVAYFSIPGGTLKENNNTLIIHPESTITDQPDDIRVSSVILFNTSINNLLSEASLNIHVGIPSRLTILNESNALQPVNAFPADTLAIRSGVIYSATGNYSFSLPAGKYKIYASRGFEYGVDSALITIKAKQKITRKLSIKHEVELKDWVSCDPHIHTLEYSGHGDASMKERVLTIAGEGLDYAVITEHNKAVNIEDTVRKMGMDKWFTTIRGDELTTKVGHFNIFPVEDSVPSPDVTNWNEVTQNLSKSSDKKIIILNHARDVHNGFRPSDSFKHILPGQFPANAMEVINSGSQQTDPRQLYLDWMGLMNRGIFLTPVGSSDSHDVSRFIVGQARTYVRKDPSFIESFISGRVGVSFGLFTELGVDTNSSDEKISISIKVYSPSWIKPQKVTLYANGEKIYSSLISAKDKISSNIFLKKTNIRKYPHEIILVAVAEGPDPKVPWWPIAKPYQHTSPVVNPVVLGISGAHFCHPEPFTLRVQDKLREGSE